MDVHPTHKTRGSDASTFDEICVWCGATDAPGGGLNEGCPNAPRTGESEADHAARLVQERAARMASRKPLVKRPPYTMDGVLYLMKRHGKDLLIRVNGETGRISIQNHHDSGDPLPGWATWDTSSFGSGETWAEAWDNFNRVGDWSNEVLVDL